MSASTTAATPVAPTPCGAKADDSKEPSPTATAPATAKATAAAALTAAAPSSTPQKGLQTASSTPQKGLQTASSTPQKGLQTASSTASAMTQDIVHVHTSTEHSLTIRGQTLTAFRQGVDQLCKSAELFLISDHVGESLNLLHQWVLMSAKDNQEVFQAVESYWFGSSISRILHGIKQMIEFMMERFKQPPKKFDEWKECKDEKCRELYASIALAVNGLTTLKGYADEIHHQIPIFRCLLSPRALAGVTQHIPVATITEQQMTQHAMFPTASPAFAVIGDCNEEFWCTEAKRTAMSGYFGLKRNCSHWE